MMFTCMLISKVLGVLDEKIAKQFFNVLIRALAAVMF